MLEAPDPIQVLMRLKRAIEQNKRPAIMLHEFLASGKAEANLIANYIIEHREAIEMLTSPKGRKWIYTWLNDTLNYLERIAKEATK